MIDAPDSIAFLVRSMLEANLSMDAIVIAVRVAEAPLRKTARDGASVIADLNRRRDADAERQKNKRRNCHGTPNPTVLTDESVLSTEVDSQGSKNARPGKIAAPTDDWPDDYADRFWSTWPKGERKHGRKQVFAKLEKIRRDREATWAALNGGLVAYVASIDDPRYIPAPIVWLNQTRWEADYTPRGRPSTTGRNGQPTFTDLVLDRIKQNGSRDHH